MRITSIILMFIVSFLQLEAVSEIQIFNLLESEKWDEAIIDLEQLITGEPQNPRLHYNLGVAFYHTHRYASAESAFKEALNLKIDAPIIQAKIYHNLGNTYFERGRAFYLTQPDLTYDLWSSALAQYKISLEIAPESPNTEQNMQTLMNLLKAFREKSDLQDSESEANSDNSPEQDGESQEEQESSSDSTASEANENESADNPESSNRDSSSQDSSNEQAGGSTPSGANESTMATSISQEEALIFLQSLQNQEKRLFPENIGREQDESSQPDW